MLTLVKKCKPGLALSGTSKHGNLTMPHGPPISKRTSTTALRPTAKKMTTSSRKCTKLCKKLASCKGKCCKKPKLVIRVRTRRSRGQCLTMRDSRFRWRKAWGIMRARWSTVGSAGNELICLFIYVYGVKLLDQEVVSLAYCAFRRMSSAYAALILNRMN